MMMRRSRGFSQLVAVELKMFFREPVAVLFGVGFPLMILAVFGSTIGQQPAFDDFRVVDLFVPGLVAMVTAYLGIGGIPIVCAEYREMGVFRRYKVSPVPLEFVSGAQVVVGLAALVLASLLLIGVAIGAFNVPVEGNLLAFVAIALLGALSMFSLGFAVASVVRTARTAQSVASGLFLPMIFLSGAALPRSQFPDWMRSLSEVIPLTHLVDTLTAAWIGQAFTSNDWISLFLLFDVAVISAGFARLTFKWE